MNKRCAFLGSPLSQNFAMDQLLHGLCRVINSTCEVGRQDDSTQKLLLYLVNSVTVIAFNEKRRSYIDERTLESLLHMDSFFTLNKGVLGLPYSPRECLQILLSRSR